MRQYSINISGRVKNFPLPKNKPLIPMFEAIVNSLHAIEERKREDPSFQSGKISIALLRDEQQSFIGELPTIEGFTISDNGIGFNDRNMESFSESDSAYKSNIGGKGVGRFSWLKTFPNVHITSIYKENGFHLKREFDFSLSNKEIDDSLIEYAEYEDNCTTITFNRYRHEYIQYIPKQAETIAMRIIQHCLVYFIDQGCPEIIITDGNDVISLNTLFKEKFKTESNTDTFLIENVEFSLLNCKIEERAFKGNRLYLCANNRLVDSKELEKSIVDLDKQIFERNGFGILVY